MSSLKTEFLEEVNSCQGIIHQICRIYEQDPESRKDLYQEILYQLWKSYPRFEGKSKFSTWLYRVALNTAITYFDKRRKTDQKEMTVSDIPDTQEQPVNVEGKIEILYKSIAELGRVDKALIMLFLEDKKYEEIADIMGMTTSNVGVRLLRAKKKLEGLMIIKTQEI